MQNLSAFFTAAHINALNAAYAAAKKTAHAAARLDKYTYINDNMWEFLYDIAANIGQRLTPKFWDNLDFTLEMHGGAIVCFKGKNDRITMPVVKHNAAWAKRLGEMLKCGYIIAWIGGKYPRRITWDNWAQTYAQLTARPKTAREIADEKARFNTPISALERSKICERRRREHNFHEVAKVSGRKSAVTVAECCFQRENNRVIVAEDRRTIQMEAYTSVVNRQIRRILKG